MSHRLVLLFMLLKIVRRDKKSGSQTCDIHGGVVCLGSGQGQQEEQVANSNALASGVALTRKKVCVRVLKSCDTSRQHSAAFREFPHGDIFSMEIVSKQCSLCYMQELATAVRTLKELDEWKSKVDSASSSLQMILPQPAVLFNPYVAIVALQEVVNVTKDKEDDRATSFQIVSRQCHRLVNSPNLQQILIKLVATKEEADVAKVLAKATKEPASVHQGSFGG